jgi:hypothetical protein
VINLYELGKVVVMATVGDVIRITTKGLLQGQEVLNVFFYNINIDDTGGVDLAELGVQWGVDFDTEVVSALSTQLQYQNIILENLTDGFEFFEGTYNATGDATGQSLPVHDSLSVKLLRSSKLTRNGRKSFAGLTEDQQSSGNVALSALVISDIETFLGQPFTYVDPVDNSLQAILQPVIVGRTLDANGVYQLDLSRLNPITGATVNPRVRTQNTRK